jgi:hypothetical protein
MMIEKYSSAERSFFKLAIKFARAFSLSVYSSGFLNLFKVGHEKTFLLPGIKPQGGSSSSGILELIARSVAMFQIL